MKIGTLITIISYHNIAGIVVSKKYGIEICKQYCTKYACDYHWSDNCMPIFSLTGDDYHKYCCHFCYPRELKLLI